MNDTAPDSKTFRMKRQGQNIAMAVIFLIITVTCFVQTYQRIVLKMDSGFASWWFFLFLGIGFLYLTLESTYKAFFSRLVLDQTGFALHDFLKVRRFRWDQVDKIGELDLKTRNRKDYGVYIKDSAIANPNMLTMPFISLLPFFEKWNDDPIQIWLKAHQPRLLKK